MPRHSPWQRSRRSVLCTSGPRAGLRGPSERSPGNTLFDTLLECIRHVMTLRHFLLHSYRLVIICFPARGVAPSERKVRSLGARAVALQLLSAVRGSWARSAKGGSKVNSARGLPSHLAGAAQRRRVLPTESSAALGRFRFLRKLPSRSRFPKDSPTKSGACAARGRGTVDRLGPRQNTIYVEHQTPLENTIYVVSHVIVECQTPLYARCGMSNAFI